MLTREGIFGEIDAGIVPHNTDNNLIQNCESGLPAYTGCRYGPEIGTTTVLTLCYKDLVAVGEQMSRDVERQRHVEGRERCRSLCKIDSSTRYPSRAYGAAAAPRQCPVENGPPSEFCIRCFRRIRAFDDVW